MSASTFRRESSTAAQRSAAARLYATDGAVPASIGAAAHQGAPPRTANAPIPKNAREELRIELTEFKGHRLIDIRVWADPRDGGSERVPTKAGIACKVALLPQLIAALQKAEAAAREHGILP